MSGRTSVLFAMTLIVAAGAFLWLDSGEEPATDGSHVPPTTDRSSETPAGSRTTVERPEAAEPREIPVDTPVSENLPEEHASSRPALPAALDRMDLSQWMDPRLGTLDLDELAAFVAEHLDADRILAELDDPGLHPSERAGLVLFLGFTRADGAPPDGVTETLVRLVEGDADAVAERMAALHALRLQGRTDRLGDLVASGALGAAEPECTLLALQTLSEVPSAGWDELVTAVGPEPSRNLIALWAARVRAGGLAEAHESAAAVRRGDGLASSALGSVRSPELRGLLLEFLPPPDGTPFQKSLAPHVVASLMRVGERQDLEQVLQEAGRNPSVQAALLRELERPRDLGQYAGLLELVTSPAARQDPQLLAAAEQGWQALDQGSAWHFATKGQQEAHRVALRRVLRDGRADLPSFRWALAELEKRGTEQDTALLDEARARL